MQQIFLHGLMNTLCTALELLQHAVPRRKHWVSFYPSSPIYGRSG